jgi:hypothetical protein
MLSNDGVDPVERAMVHIEVIHLILLKPWAPGRDGVQTGVGVGAVFSDDDRLPFAGPGPQLRFPVDLGRLEVAGVESIKTSPNWDTRHLPCGDSIRLTKPTVRVGRLREYPCRVRRVHWNDQTQRDRWMRIIMIILPIVWGLLGTIISSPLALVLLAGILNAVFLMGVAVATLYLTHAQTDPRTKDGTVSW